MRSLTPAPARALDLPLAAHHTGRLRALALRALERMYRPGERVFAHCLRKGPAGIAAEGASLRYTAIALIGLAGESEASARTALGGDGRDAPLDKLAREVAFMERPGDAALALWATAAAGHDGTGRARARLRQLDPGSGPIPTVELAWALSALTVDEATDSADRRRQVAGRLLAAFDDAAGLFPHAIGGGSGLRSHVACFADQVYPIQALARYGRVAGDRAALRAARRCAARICEAQGPRGQWWWHYDARTGAVLEPYPVYSVHQHAMAPMALLDLAEATGQDFSPEIRRGLAWMFDVAELSGRSLLDRDADLAWRKVARREPAKLSRTLQALASRAHRSLRVPGLSRAFPPSEVDHESRPYEYGWLLYAWPEARSARWDAGRGRG